MTPEQSVKFRFQIMPINKLYWSTAMPIHLYIVYGIVWLLLATTVAELSRCERDVKTCKA